MENFIVRYKISGSCMLIFPLTIRDRAPKESELLTVRHLGTGDNKKEGSNVQTGSYPKQYEIKQLSFKTEGLQMIPQLEMKTDKFFVHKRRRW